MKDLSLGAIVSHLIFLVLFSTASLSAVGSDVSEFPFSVKEYYARDRELCDEFIGNFKTAALENYKKFGEVQKDLVSLGSITLFNDAEDVLGLITGEDLEWKEPSITHDSTEIHTMGAGDFMYSDINNDGDKELVVRFYDGNRYTHGYGWRVTPGDDPSKGYQAPSSSSDQTKYFDFRSNNIDESSVDLGEGYHYHGYRDDRAQGTSRNFHFKFSKKDGKVYVLLMLHYGYDYVFQENLILADLDENFRIDNQFCHYEIVQNFDIHPLRHSD